MAHRFNGGKPGEGGVVKRCLDCGGDCSHERPASYLAHTQASRAASAPGLEWLQNGPEADAIRLAWESQCDTRQVVRMLAVFVDRIEVHGV